MIDQIEKLSKIQEYRKSYRIRKPWMIVWGLIRTRCIYDKNHIYYKKGIKVDITIQELKDLWFKNKAYLLKRASIDRIDSKKDYTKENCRFIELSDNIRMGMGGKVRSERKARASRANGKLGGRPKNS